MSSCYLLNAYICADYVNNTLQFMDLTTQGLTNPYGPDQPETSRMVWFGNSSRSVTCTAACMYLYHFTETLHIMLRYVTSLSI